MSSPLVSIILPTFNRGADLQEAIQSLLAQDYPQFEILVVDNNSTDGTAEQVKELAASEPRVRYLHEPKPGVNFARNLGCQEARGDLLAFLDDDEVAPAQWLSRLVEAMGQTGAGAIGGPYAPIWQKPAPWWLVKSRCLQETLSFMDFGNRRREIEWLLGGNALYTRSALRDASLFGMNPGRTGLGKMVGGGDIAVGARVRRAGHSVWFEPSAVVQHKIPPERMRLSYVLRRAFWAGYNDIAIGREWKLGDKVGKAARRGPDALAVGLMILPGILWGRLMVRLGYLQPQTE